MPDHGDDAGLLARHRPSGGTHAAQRRVAGIHRAEGLADTPWRYAVIVGFLVSMASLPTLAAISAGSATLADDDAGRTTPFIAPRADMPVVVVPVFPVPVGTQPTLVPVTDGVARAAESARRRPTPRRDGTRGDRPRSGRADQPLRSKAPPPDSAPDSSPRNQPPAPPTVRWEPPIPPTRPPMGRHGGGPRRRHAERRRRRRR